MTDQDGAEETKRDAGAAAEGGEEAVGPLSAGDAVTDDPKDAEEKELTPEEQMARYEESLKDEDWGHQPC